MHTETKNPTVFLPPDPAHVPENGIGTYIPGGRNVMAHRYTHSKGYPQFPDRAQFIGTLEGDWHEMGRQFGARSGDAVRCVSDIWWKRQCTSWGLDETRKAIALYETHIRALDPGLIAFMDHASPALFPRWVVYLRRNRNDVNGNSHPHDVQRVFGTRKNNLEQRSNRRAEPALRLRPGATSKST